MNFWTLSALILAGVYVTGFAALFICAKFAREGYEDREGFHFGAEPTDASNRPTGVTIKFTGVDAKLPNVA